MGESYVTTDNPKFYIKDEYGNMKELVLCQYGRNPYFIGINSAIQ